MNHTECKNAKQKLAELIISEEAFIDNIIINKLNNYQYINKSGVDLIQMFKQCKKLNIYPFKRECIDGQFIIPSLESYYLKSNIDIIKLSNFEIEVANCLGECRYATNIFSRKKGDNFSYDQGEQYHIKGCLHEIAGCKFLDLFPDFTMDCGVAFYGLDKGDANVHHVNCSVDWKAVRKGFMYVKKTKANNNIGLFGAIEESQEGYRCLGFISAKEVFNNHSNDESIKINRSRLNSIGHYYEQR